MMPQKIPAHVMHNRNDAAIIRKTIAKQKKADEYKAKTGKRSMYGPTVSEKKYAQEKAAAIHKGKHRFVVGETQAAYGKKDYYKYCKTCHRGRAAGNHF
jgi:cytochrome c5